MSAMTATMGRNAISSGRQAPGGMNGSTRPAPPDPPARAALRLFAKMRTAHAVTPVASQKGKNPAPGPAAVHPIGRRSASRTKMIAPSNSPSAITNSALLGIVRAGGERGRTGPAQRLLLGRQSSLDHEAADRRVLLLEPAHEVGPDLKRLGEGAALDEVRHLAGLHELAKEVDVERGGVGRHLGGPEHPAHHLVLDRKSEFLDRRHVLPARRADPLVCEDGEGTQPRGIPVADHLYGDRKS